MLGICWGYVGDMLGICWGYVGDMLGICWGYVGDMLGICWIFDVIEIPLFFKLRCTMVHQWRTQVIVGTIFNQANNGIYYNECYFIYYNYHL